jgi:O-acetyl-ADP-ribose deacetylase (regulator of RNase III)
VIRYVVGDATRPLGHGPRIIAHVSNDCGVWGAGFVLAISRRWPEPEREYRAKCPRLGMTQFVSVGDGIVVANMVAQSGVGRADGRPLRYVTLAKCLQDVAVYALCHDASAHMPRIGCGLGGGDWHVVEPLIEETLIDRGVEVMVYDLEST